MKVGAYQFAPFQTAPTALYDKSGHTLIELSRNTEGLLVYELEKSEPDFGERGRIELSDDLAQYRTAKDIHAT